MSKSPSLLSRDYFDKLHPMRLKSRLVKRFLEVLHSSDMLRNSWAFAVAMAGCFLVNCTNAKAPLWSQSHGDAANSGQVLIASKPASATAMQKLSIGNVAYSSPVLSPDGTTAYIATFSPTPSPQGNEVIAISIASPPSIKHSWPLGGELSTPAVDTAGNIYVAQYFQATQQSNLVSLSSTGQKRFSHSINGQARALSAPKILQTSVGDLVFQTYIGGIPIGGHVLVVDAEGNNAYDQWTCGRITGGISLPGVFHTNGIDLGPPYPEDAAIALRTIQTSQGAQTYGVIATAKCGIVFYRLDLSKLPLTAYSFHTIASKDSNSAWFGSPAINLNGMGIVTDGDQKVTGFDVTTGKQKWQYRTTGFVSTSAAFIPLGMSTVYIADYSRLTKLDSDTGQNASDTGLIGPVDAAPVVSETNIYVSTYSGLFTYDFSLKLLAFTALNGGLSTPAIAPSGQVLAADSAGSFFLFGGS